MKISQLDGHYGTLLYRLAIGFITFGIERVHLEEGKLLTNSQYYPYVCFSTKKVFSFGFFMGMGREISMWQAVIKAIIIRLGLC